jgi:citrate/tricarballylate utilization protein
MPAEMAAGGRAQTRLDLLVEEATRQLNVCNACRYCEGFCAVYPALERRTLLTAADVSQMANLCHDCRACFDACMYTEPHAFSINVPKALSAVRVEDYRRYVWPTSPPRVLRGWLGIVVVATAWAVLFLGVAVANAGFGGLVANPEVAASPYDLIPYPLMLGLFLAPALFSVVVTSSAGVRFWRSGRQMGVPGGASPLSAVLRSTWDAMTLRYLRGGGGDCYYPEEDRPSPQRRRLHSLVSYGFLLCFVSTIAAAIMQDLLHSDPPYPVLSVPVVSGLVGGVGLVLGCLGLLQLKARAADVMSVAQMTVKDYGLLVALTCLALTGIATLLTRSTPAYGPVLLVHLASVAVAFGVAPYSKFVHVLYRFLALVRDNLERTR